MTNKVTGSLAKVGGLVINGSQVNATSTELNTVADLSANGALDRVKVISITGAGSTSEQDSTYDLPTLCVVNDVFVEVTSAATSAAALHVGLLSTSSGGDADGFLVNITSSSTGLKGGLATVSTSGGAFSEYFISTTRGAYLQSFYVGSSTAVGGSGIAYDKRHLADSVTAKSVSWTLNSTAVTFTGRIVIRYTEMSS